MPNTLDENIQEFKIMVKNFYIDTYLGATGVPQIGKVGFG